MRILFVASEAFPLIKVGGLADVTSSLAVALRDLGHEPCFVLPRYAAIEAPIRNAPEKSISVALGTIKERVAVSQTMIREGIPVYLVENDDYFGTQDVYTQDELRRFLFFSRCIPGVITELDLRPDIVHCHDWHTALVPLWLKEARMPLPVVFTIHNLAYQGPFDPHFLDNSGISSVWDEHIPRGTPQPGLNFMSQGLLMADVLTTVSPSYASEILTMDYGESVGQLLKYRRDDLHGIVNGIDYDEFDPATDPNLRTNYDCATITRRAENKLALQRNSRLPQDPDTPLLGMVSRLEEQKGIDLLLQAIEPLVAGTETQMVILGRGQEHYQTALVEAARRFPERLSVSVAYDEQAARLIYGGCDFFLMPSRFEPCGLGQLIAMRYGAVPVVRHTGGLTDTVKDVNWEGGNGFAFTDYSADAMLGAIKRAEASFRHRDAWQDLIRHNMKQDFSWSSSARRYEEIYLLAQNASRARSS